MPVKRFNRRALVALLVSFGFLVMSVTGLVLFVVPQGRIAHWVDWRLLGLLKDDWSDLHIITSLLFIAAGVLHLLFNWKTFVAYLRERLKGHQRPRREGLVALAVVGLLLVGTLLHVPPFNWILAANEAMRTAWSRSPGAEPPFGHAEEVRLDVLAQRTGLEGPSVVAAIRAAGLTVTSGDETLRQVADANGTTPAAVWAAISPLVVATIEATEWTRERVEERFAGSGLGRRTLQQIADDTGLDLSQVTARVAALGVPDASAEMTLRAAAESTGSAPMDMLTAILVPGWTPRSEPPQ